MGCSGRSTENNVRVDGNPDCPIIPSGWQSTLWRWLERATIGILGNVPCLVVDHSFDEGSQISIFSEKAAINRELIGSITKPLGAEGKINQRQPVFQNDAEYIRDILKMRSVSCRQNHALAHGKESIYSSDDERQVLGLQKFRVRYCSCRGRK